MRLFDRASAKLKYPKIRFTKYQLYRTSGGNYPGAIYVSPLERDSGWYARIEITGLLTLNKYQPLPGLEAELQRLASDPTRYAQDYGHTTGNCCFCKKTLTDERSLFAGYGPDCAGHYGLPYPTRIQLSK